MSSTSETRGASVTLEDKACPFCGGRELTIKPIWKDHWFVACKCKAAGAPGKTIKAAWDKWNKRRPEEKPQVQEVLF